MEYMPDRIPIEILLVEDNPGDVRLTQEALKEGKINNKMSIVSDGIEALEFLRKTGKYCTAIRPDLILLDLNLPRKNGREVLVDIKTDQDLKHIPVIILTTSKDEADVLYGYAHYANCYIVKPVDLNQFLNAVKVIADFWMSIVKLPNK